MHTDPTASDCRVIARHVAVVRCIRVSPGRLGIGVRTGENSLQAGNDPCESSIKARRSLRQSVQSVPADRGRELAGSQPTAASRGSPAKIGIWPPPTQARYAARSGRGLRPWDPRRKPSAWILRDPGEPCREDPAAPCCPSGRPRGSSRPAPLPEPGRAPPGGPLGGKGELWRRVALWGLKFHPLCAQPTLSLVRCDLRSHLTH